jgi:hypothetical protein
VLMSTSANALKLTIHYQKKLISHFNLHCITNIATPSMFSKCKLALTIYKIYNLFCPLDEWIQLNLNHVFTSRQTNFNVNRNFNHNVGINAISN